ncbi:MULTISPECIES: HTH-type transcriptional activator AllS [Erwiniaceae]|uniref:HTH-type transcriptional activator AllS n=1 Tax=Pantoea coffeiphila TaxID=1465635 RepID=A0A2S9IHJ7_9GAMM|nr:MULTISPECIES: HTH-type transcriptional activator AllS [Erwiniaceae]MCW1876044.1 HTH-type transcriptional activator AllS [Erwinia sp. INIA01]PRD17258.1 HTH-type transcriptional activator AllS [Pantoea coffeiphila]
MLDQETIRTFIHVAESHSFSKTAEALFKTPAAISYRIKMLEEDVGTQLFMRTTRIVQLTPAGDHLLERCRQWLAWLDAMPGELQQINHGVERQVNIVINNLLYSPQAVAKLLAHLHQKFPLTQFLISRQVYMGVWDSLLHDDFQLAIGVTGSEALANNVSMLELGGVSWLFVVAADHPLAECEGPVHEDKLRAWPAINIEDTSRNLTKRVAWLLPGQKEIIVPDLSSKLECHLQGLGVGFLPAELCQRYINSGQLVSCEVANQRQPSPLSLAWKNEAGKAVEEIVALFQQRDEAIGDFLQNIDLSA